MFAGGRSVHRALAQHRPEATHLLPDGLEHERFAAARALRRPRARPVAGYVGVIDDRLDLDLLAELAAALPDWDLRMVGPVVKVDPASLPRAPNLVYRGPLPSRALPALLAGFDVAVLPFAQGAFRSVRPSRILEYLAAGLPVVSTPLPALVANHSAVLEPAADAAGMAEACRRVRLGQPVSRLRAGEALVRLQDWDSIVERMSALVENAGQAREDSA